MLDCYNRSINYLRISLTDRCNLRCTYCMPESGRSFMPTENLLSDEELIECVTVAAKYGVTKIRLTGGEPLVRDNVEKLIQDIAAVNGINDIAITTNGILLKKNAKKLALAGLKRVNISLDAMNPQKYSEITRGGNILDVLDGINAARDAGLSPIKVNCVIDQSKEEPDAQEVAKFCLEQNINVRFIRKMNLEEGIFFKVDGGDGGDCANCNRMRLTANGYFKPCLFNSKTFSVRELGAEQAFLDAIKKKPIKGTVDKVNAFYNIGG